jgi:hypothetical protein
MKEQLAAKLKAKADPLPSWKQQILECREVIGGWRNYISNPPSSCDQSDLHAVLHHMNPVPRGYLIRQLFSYLNPPGGAQRTDGASDPIDSLSRRVVSQFINRRAEIQDHIESVCLAVDEALIRKLEEEPDERSDYVLTSDFGEHDIRYVYHQTEGSTDYYLAAGVVTCLPESHYLRTALPPRRFYQYRESNTAVVPLVILGRCHPNLLGNLRHGSPRRMYSTAVIERWTTSFRAKQIRDSYANLERLEVDQFAEVKANLDDLDRLKKPARNLGSAPYPLPEMNWSDGVIKCLDSYAKLTKFISAPGPDASLDDLIAVKQTLSGDENLPNPAKDGAQSFVAVHYSDVRKQDLIDAITKMFGIIYFTLGARLEEQWFPYVN